MAVCWSFCAVLAVRRERKRWGREREMERGWGCEARQGIAKVKEGMGILGVSGVGPRGERVN